MWTSDDGSRRIDQSICPPTRLDDLPTNHHHGQCNVLAKSGNKPNGRNSVVSAHLLYIRFLSLWSAPKKPANHWAFARQNSFQSTPVACGCFRATLLCRRYTWWSAFEGSHQWDMRWRFWMIVMAGRALLFFTSVLPLCWERTLPSVIWWLWTLWSVRFMCAFVSCIWQLLLKYMSFN